MSVEISPYNWRRTRSIQGEELTSITTVNYATRDYGREIDSVEIRPAKIAKAPGRQPAEKVVRRLQGFLVEDQGEEYKVALVEDDTLIFYYLPASQLRKAGIAVPNQPFQMDEVEITSAAGRLISGYSFVPLAKPSDVFNDAIDLDKNDRRNKLNRIFKKFGKA